MAVALFVDENITHQPTKLMSSSEKRKLDYDQSRTTLEKPASDARDIKTQKRRRQQNINPASYIRTHSSSPKAEHPPSPTKVGTLLASCHICRRRPMTKTDLTGYAGCDSCNKRTCYICMRECEEADCKLSSYTSQDDESPIGTVLKEQASEGCRRRQRLCRDCTVECVYEDGTDISRCLHCAQVELWHSPLSIGKLQPP